MSSFISRLFITKQVFAKIVNVPFFDNMYVISTNLQISGKELYEEITLSNN